MYFYFFRYKHAENEIRSSDKTDAIKSQALPTMPPTSNSVDMSPASFASKCAENEKNKTCQKCLEMMWIKLYFLYDFQNKACV